MNYNNNPSPVSSCPVCTTILAAADPESTARHHLAICTNILPFHPDCARDPVPESGRTSTVDLYDRLLEKLQIPLIANPSELFRFKADLDQGRGTLPAAAEQKLIDRAFDVAGKKCRKECHYFSTSELLGTKKVSEVNLMLALSRYPEEDDPCPHVPQLLLKRATLLVKKPPQDMDYKLVLEDLALVEKWLKFLPPEKHHNLFYMKTLCLMRLKLFADANQSLVMAGLTLGKSDLSSAARDERIEKLRKGRQSILRNGSDNVELKITPQDADIPRVQKANKRFPALSASVDVVSRPSTPEDARTFKKKFMDFQFLFFFTMSPMKTPGRGIVATKTIRPGDIIAVEEPIVAGLRHDLFHVLHTHCHHCLVSTVHLLPCPVCCLAMFCSLRCRDDALASFHKYECSLGLPLLSFAFGPSFQFQICLGLRLLFSRTPEFWVESELEYKFLRNPEYDMNAYLKKENNNNVYSSTELKHLFNLENKRSCFDSRDTIGGHFHLRAWMMVLQAMKLVKTSGYLQGRDADTEDVVTTVLENAFRVSRINSLVMTEEIKKVVDKQEEAFEIRQAEFAQGVYNTVSLFNHSCFKNAVRFNIGRKTVVVASKTIKPNEEVFLSYMYGLLSIPARNRLDCLLSQFNLVCECVACDNLWAPIEHSSVPTLSADELDCFREKNFDRLLELRRLDSEKFERFVKRNVAVEDVERKMAYWNDVGAQLMLLPLRLKHCVKCLW